MKRSLRLRVLIYSFGHLLLALKTFEYKDTKVLIFISNVMTWSATPPKEKANLFL